MKKNHLFANLFALLAVLALVSLNAWAQTSSSRISGTITDATGALVPGAKVTIKDEATGVTYNQTTTGAGLFTFPSLPVGKYTVSVEMKGFKTINKTGNVLEVGTPLVVDAVLEVGQASEIVNIEGGYERLQTSNATIGNVVSQKAIEALPLNGRNPLILITLEPGVTQRSFGGIGSGIHVNGSRDRAYNVTIDGIEANESTVPNPVSNLYRINPDNIQEYKVTTNNATAEEGRNSGASVSIATRGGSNDYHGTVWEFARNTALNANDFFANARGTQKPEVKLHQYGLEGGGPIIKNKTFFFGSWQGQKVKFTQPIDQTFGFPTIYTPSALAGKYRYFKADAANPFRINGVAITNNSPLLVDRRTGAYAAGVHDCVSATELNCVASYDMFANDPRKIGIDPTVAKLFSSYPKPNDYAVGDGLNTATYAWNPPTENQGPNWAARIDHTLNAKNSIFGRFLYADQNTRKGDPLNGRPQVFPGFAPLGEVYRASKNLSLGWRSQLTPSINNELIIGFSRFFFLFTQGEANPDFPNTLPFANSGNFNNASTPFINTPRTARGVTTPQLLDNVGIVHGAHQIGAGLNIRFYQHNDQRGQPGGINVTPSLSFSATVLPPTLGATTGINATDLTRLRGTVNDVLGIPARLTQVFIGDIKSDTFLPFVANGKVSLFDVGTRIKQYNAYGQDEWKLRPNLTINYGVRMELNSTPKEAAGRVYIAQQPIDGSQGLVTYGKGKSFYNGDHDLAFGPRLGIAWSPGKSNKFVIRSGYGIAFDPVSSFQVTAVMGRPPGLVTTCVSTVGIAPTPGCAAVPSDKRLGEGFPLALAAPTTKPSSFFTPPATLLSNASPVAAFDPNYQMPTVHQWNLSMQYELPKGFVGQAAYIGRRGTHLQRAYDINQIDGAPILNDFRAMQANIAKNCTPDGTATLDTTKPGCSGGQLISIVNYPTTIANSPKGPLTQAFVNSGTTITELQQGGVGSTAGRIEQTTLALKLRPNQQFGIITYIDAGGDSYYHAAQFTLRKRFEKGFLFGMAYTFAKSIDDQSFDPVGASSGGGLSTTSSRAPTTIRDWRNERARSDFDRTHVLTVNGVWEAPFGKGKWLDPHNGVANMIVGGWSLNGIYTKMSGEPFSVRSNVRTLDNSHDSRALVIKPVEAKLQDKAGVAGPVVFADASAFAIPAAGADGSGRNIFISPGYWNVDLGINKAFQLTERFKLDFRAELFNALNHTNFDNPRDASTGSPSILATTFGQTCCASVAPPTTQTIIQTGEAARVIQFALKLKF
ncbi:MAG: TonB-dependent receptor [Acidobacteria bacterium]|nr:TonB-dependent receptor [Acidobacteriota bacterium]MBI3426866.1 TonB-dependent receptor [Acidobacteriota bacterium]